VHQEGGDKKGTGPSSKRGFIVLFLTERSACREVIVQREDRASGIMTD